MERAEVKETPIGRQKRHWGAFKVLIALFGFGLRLLGLYERGVRNAIDIRLNRLDLWFETLPKEFDGFRLLQLTDLHADFLPETLHAALELTVDVEADICVLTGDFRRRVKGSFDEILPAMEMLTSQISTRHGTYAVLGNHDCADMVEPFEALGIRVLVNETHTIFRDGAELHLTGTDDVHYYYTDAARQALAAAPMTSITTTPMQLAKPLPPHLRGSELL
jgi:predicted MPP superfamily phosphohydrolase